MSALPDPTVRQSNLEKLRLPREFHSALKGAELWPYRAGRIEILQLNVGKLCNQRCHHCHVDAGPDRRESMSRETMELCLAALAVSEIPTVDITGGAPELNPHFRWLVAEVRARGRQVIDRCNLTILSVPAHRDLPEFLARHRVEVVCSLPHYRPLQTDRQRGDGVFEKSIAGLQALNAVGYGDGDSGLRLSLVTNPAGAFLPPSQASAEAEWKRELWDRYRIRFDHLLTLTNMPIGRYLDWLDASGNLAEYMDTLCSGFNPRAAQNAMCRNTLSVGWDGALYDCDFNQMLALGFQRPLPSHIRDFSVAALERREIRVGRHCFGCTAGAGSSCGGATAE